MAIDLLFRAVSRARWLAVATNRGIYDEEGNVNPNFAVDELGNVVITPATYDAEGNETSPAVIDSWWAVNLRIFGSKADDDADDLYAGETEGFRFVRSKLAKWIRQQATVVNLRGIRAYQFGSGDNRIQLLDPRDITTPVRVWLGGMHL